MLCSCVIECAVVLTCGTLKLIHYKNKFKSVCVCACVYTGDNNRVMRSIQQDEAIVSISTHSVQ